MKQFEYWPTDPTKSNHSEREERSRWRGVLRLTMILRAVKTEAQQLTWSEMFGQVPSFSMHSTPALY